MEGKRSHGSLGGAGGGSCCSSSFTAARQCLLTQAMLTRSARQGTRGTTQTTRLPARSAHDVAVAMATGRLVCCADDLSLSSFEFLIRGYAYARDRKSVV